MLIMNASNAETRVRRPIFWSHRPHIGVTFGIQLRHCNMASTRPFRAWDNKNEACAFVYGFLRTRLWSMLLSVDFFVATLPTFCWCSRSTSKFRCAIASTIARRALWYATKSASIVSEQNIRCSLEVRINGIPSHLWFQCCMEIIFFSSGIVGRVLR